ncbi:TPA: response regulator transcription factor [Pseudomonas putida]|uniref:response regulator transcription factor n=1 Tax=Pseudomonas TaxID=286 RepID=UPI000480F147|nr:MULTISPECIES: response regulator transcription factor [Pseudomonas]MDD2149489.1 response regulator transcription factor [Pseudomonas putida]RAS30541.1 LuxR family two component transcriptional regulator [Pseudomonas sp. URMO17WK12:I7]SMF54601.1 two component transcriptional regulator, LuxR family [Pseudomonas sp. URMO17WK12:I5]HDS1681161.1 response regulator transcription factor [Pseudomonas putida]
MQAKVYVVDDDQGMRDSTVWLLESVGLQGVPFASGQAFLDACVDDGPACVLLDVRMPGLGGMAVQQALRERGLQIPVIFVSGHADVPIVVRAFKAGASDFIEKPYSDQLLLDSVQAALERAGQARQDDLVLAAVQARLDALTPRERDVFVPLAQGLSNREIAERLGISVKTVDLYRGRVMKRLQAQSLAELVGMAIACGAVEALGLRAR